MSTTISAALLLGFLLGLRHALDPDHVVAVSTIVSEQKSIARSTLIGTLWGLGHTAALFVMGLAVLLLRVSIPPDAATLMELGVAGMLVVLGGTAVRAVVREGGLRIHAHTHVHDGETLHTHLHVHGTQGHNHRHYLLKLGRKPFLVGVVHGVAGSAALTLFVLSTIPSVVVGLAYIALFGVGSVGGMLVMSALVSVPFVATARRFSSINLGVRITAGLFSIVFGLVLGWSLITDLGR